jgi:trehalose/maltose hydrolase-like predicted phosphorylase
VADLLARRWPARWAHLRDALALTDAELAGWGDVAGRLALGFDPASGLFEQFAGFHQLERVDLAAYATRTAPLDVVLGRERVQRAQVIKQADVVMLLALLWERYPPAVREANYRYYAPRCGHGSSLSPAVHALVAARLGHRAAAAGYFRQAAALDLDDTLGNTAQGVHIGALGGLWQAAVLGFGGLTLAPDGLRFEPHLPPKWRALRFAVQWQGRRLRIQLSRAPHGLRATLESGSPLVVYAGERSHRLAAGETWTCPLTAARAVNKEHPP